MTRDGAVGRWLLGAVVSTATCLTLSAQSAQWVLPSEPDLMIRTRDSIDRPHSATITKTVFLKGARQRSEQLWEYSDASSTQHQSTMIISQCDTKRSIQVNPDARLYAVVPFPDPVEAATRHQRLVETARTRGAQAASGPEVVVVIDGVDTGERRQVGRYQARHVVTTTTITPSSGASTHASRRVEDGWYIDLPRPDCLDPTPGTATALGFTQVVRPGQPLDHFRIERHGVVISGFAVEKVTKVSEGEEAVATTETTRLIEVSQDTLAPTLFDVPEGYRPALPRAAGGFDLTKPDTWGNRLADYWSYVASWTANIAHAWTVK